MSQFLVGFDFLGGMLPEKVGLLLICPFIRCEPVLTFHSLVLKRKFVEFVNIFSYTLPQTIFPKYF